MMMIHTKHHKKEENAIIAQLAEFIFGKFLCVKKFMNMRLFRIAAFNVHSSLKSYG